MARLSTIKGLDTRAGDFGISGNLSVGGEDLVRVYEGAGRRPTAADTTTLGFRAGDLWVYRAAVWTEIYRAALGAGDTLEWTLVSQQPIHIASGAPSAFLTPTADFRQGRRWIDTDTNQVWVRLGDTGDAATDWVVEGSLRTSLRVINNVVVGDDLAKGEGDNARVLAPIYTHADAPSIDDDSAAGYKPHDWWYATDDDVMHRNIANDEGRAQWGQVHRRGQPSELLWTNPYRGRVNTSLSNQGQTLANSLLRVGANTVFDPVRLITRTAETIGDENNWSDYQLLIFYGFYTLNSGFGRETQEFSNTGVITVDDWNRGGEVVLGDLQFGHRGSVVITKNRSDPDDDTRFRYEGITRDNVENRTSGFAFPYTIHGVR